MTKDLSIFVVPLTLGVLIVHFGVSVFGKYWDVDSISIDMITSISLVASLVGFVIALLAFRAIVFRKNEFGKIFKELGTDSVLPTFTAFAVCPLVMLSFLGVAVCVLLYNPSLQKPKQALVWEFLFAFSAIIFYVVYDRIMIKLSHDAFKKYLTDRNENNSKIIYYRYRKSTTVYEDERFERIVKEYISSHKISYSRVDFPFLLSMSVSGIAALLIYFSYKDDTNIIRTFIAGIVCFHSILASYLFCVHCFSFLFKDKHIDSLPLNDPVKCYECPTIFMYNYNCFMKYPLTDEKKDLEILCPHFGNEQSIKRLKEASKVAKEEQ